MSTSTVVSEATLTAREQVRRALLVGGRARVTVTSRASGKYLTVRLAAKAFKDGGGYVSRATTAGRVGLAAADVLFADADDQVCKDEVGRLMLKTGEWQDPKVGFVSPSAPHYAWAARNVVAWALTDSGEAIAAFDAQAEVQLCNECCVCGHRLNDDVSVARGIGPECFGKVTGAQHV